MRKWLNETFYNQAFSGSEQGKIITTNVFNAKNDKYVKGGNNTNDKIFCLSIDEVKKYFFKLLYSDDKGVATNGTNYAKAVYNVDDKLYVDVVGYSNYWLRSPGDRQRRAATVDTNGYIDGEGSYVESRRNGVRPALWVSY